MLKKKLAAAAGLLALMQPQVAMAQDCIAPDDLSDAMIYLMPIAFDSYRETCADTLKPEGFVAREGDTFIAKYSALQDEKWDGAFRFFGTFAKKGKKGDEMAQLFDSMPPDTVRPLFDAIIRLELAKEIKVKDCHKIEGILEPLAPLPPQNFGLLVARIFELVPGKREPKVCSSEEQ